MKTRGEPGGSTSKVPEKGNKTNGRKKIIKERYKKTC